MTETTLQTLRDALTLREQMRADGASQAECDSALEEMLRERWPFTREWKYVCKACYDTGLRIERRQTRIYGDTFVDVGVPCTCKLGDRFRPRQKRDDDFTAAGKVSGPTRFGR